MNINNTLTKIIIIFSISILFYITLVLVSDYKLIAEKIGTFQIQYLPIIFLMLFLHLVISGLKFHRLLSMLKIKLSFIESLKIFTSGYSLSVTPFGIGSVIKSQIIKNKYGNSISSTAPVVFIEKWTELFAILSIISILLFWFDNIESKIIAVLGYLILGVMMAITSNFRYFKSLKRLVSKIKYLNKIQISVDESQTSFRILTKKINFLETILYSFLTKIIQLFMIFFIFVAIGIDLDFIQAGQIYYTSLLVGIFSFIPSGIVITEASMVALLVKHNVEFSTATLSVIIIRFLGMWLHTLMGTVILKLISKN